ncbi:hypothetical protein ARMSODRAFT_18201 [Armillaria solidipes]|uniref:Uncharacterized protein n=1 Tax=Armillaria solidipes TaxID=1076256 RepID=A0A2H3C4L8_9AGAR|nr:hypothetical protein ARMSODRAFT_18201 [Armillaria solidipes]
MSPLRGLSRVSPYSLPIRLSFAHHAYTSYYLFILFYYFILLFYLYLNASPYLSYYPAFPFHFYTSKFRNKLPFHLSGRGPPTSAYLNPHINPSDGHSNTSAT